MSDEEDGFVIVDFDDDDSPDDDSPDYGLNEATAGGISRLEEGFPDPSATLDEIGGLEGTSDFTVPVSDHVTLEHINTMGDAIIDRTGDPFDSLNIPVVQSRAEGARVRIPGMAAAEATAREGSRARDIERLEGMLEGVRRAALAALADYSSRIRRYDSPESLEAAIESERRAQVDARALEGRAVYGSPRSHSSSRSPGHRGGSTRRRGILRRSPRRSRPRRSRRRSRRRRSRSPRRSRSRRRVTWSDL